MTNMYREPFEGWQQATEGHSLTYPSLGLTSQGPAGLCKGSAILDQQEWQMGDDQSWF